MITINPIKLNTTQNISFKYDNNNNASKIGLMTLDKNAGNRINFEKDLYITQKADPVQSNPFKAIGYNIVKAYNILHTPKSNSVPKQERPYIHLPYMG